MHNVVIVLPVCDIERASQLLNSLSWLHHFVELVFPINDVHRPSELLGLINGLGALSVAVFLIHIDRPNELLNPLYAFEDLLELAAMGDIIDRTLEIFYSLGIGDDLTEVVGVLHPMAIDWADQVLEFFCMLDYILDKESIF